jgi:hypothetical protein
LRQRVAEAIDAHGIKRARTEIRTCGWLAQVDENGGSIFQYRPHSKGAADMGDLVTEVMELLGRETRTVEPTALSVAEELADNGIHIQQHDQAA